MPIQKAFVIRDPIHGYIHVASHERHVVDHPITQRLRRVGQTGLAHYVFPEATTSRFAHSLGAMHLASRFLIAAVENADDQSKTRFFEDVGREREDAGIPEETLVRYVFGPEQASGLLATRASLRVPNHRAPPPIYVALLGWVEAAVRLAALFHDLGHLPFSHDFEQPLLDYARESGDGELEVFRETWVQPHELIGHNLSRLVFEGLNKVEDAVARSIYRLASKILDAEEVDFRPLNLLQWLHALVDGEVDCDRADYLLRDARAFALEFASFDLERLVYNVVLQHHVRSHPDPKGGPDVHKAGYRLLFREQALGSIESFLLTRARSYQTHTRHHKVAQVNCAFRHLTAKALGSREAADAVRTIARLGSGRREGPGTAAQDDLLLAFAKLSDGWWLSQLEQLRDRGGHSVLEDACLRAVLDRSPTLVSVWKRKGDLKPALAARLRAWSEGVAAVDRPVRKALAEQGVLILKHKFSPYKMKHAKAEAESEGVKDNGSPRGELEILVRDGEVRRATELSPTIASLWQAWDNDIGVHAFTVRDAKAWSAEEVIAQLEQAAEAAKALVSKNIVPADIVGLTGESPKVG